MERRPFIAGNWKLHKTIQESVDLVTAIARGAKGIEGVDIAVAPVALSLHAVAQAAAGSKVHVAAQHTHDALQGAFTGELSPALIKDAGASHCIIGHSERRSLFGETDAGVNRKAKLLIETGLTPILCVGETLAQRDAGETLSVVSGQLRAALDGVDVAKVIIAYEPVWAIGTGRTATPEQAQEVHAAIRADLPAPVAQSTTILYGGSVKPANAASLLAQGDIDGALVGGASLDPESFLAIIDAAR